MGNQKIRIGEVVSNKMDQTAIVSVTRKYKHKLYGKYIKDQKNILHMTRKTKPKSDH